MCVFCASIRCAFESALQSSTDDGVVSYSAGQSPLPTPEDADALKLNHSWQLPELTFGFPDSGAAYDPADTAYDEEKNFLPLSSGGQDMMRTAVAAWADLIPVTLSEKSGSAAATADIRISGTSVASTAWAYPPNGSSSDAQGDIWIGVDKSYNALFTRDSTTPFVGSYEYYVAIHELGHALGLKHPHQAFGSATAIMPLEFDAVEYTVMSYRSYVGAGAGSLALQRGHFPQSLMMLDIAAIQDIYGADFSTEAGDTVYRFDPSEGRMWTNDSASPTVMRNVVFRTLWDGGGTDTIDLSAYGTNISADLTPGAGILFDTDNNAQRSLLYNGSLNKQYANYNLYMSLLHKGDTRSLIENIITGTGDDVITGNQADNRVTSLGGRNLVDGGAGTDTLFMETEAGLLLVDYSTGQMRLGYEQTMASVTNVEYVETQTGLFSIAEILAAWETSGASGPTSLVGLGLITLEEAGGIDNETAVAKGGAMFIPALTHLNVNGTSAKLVAQGADVQGVGRAQISADGSAVTLSDNAWNAALYDVTITENTVLSFDFSSTVEGEIQAIGFYSGNTYSGLYHTQSFQLYGVDTFGIQDFNTYTAQDGVVNYEIPVGEYFTGDFDRITFIGDDDAGMGSNATFANIEITETPPGLTINDSAAELVAQGAAVQGVGSAQISADGSAVTLSDNAWNAALYDVTVTKDTVLSFDFSSTAEGEIQAIGFYSGDAYSGALYRAQSFQLYGVDDYGIQDFNNYDAQDGVVKYDIPVGDYFTGTFDRIVFIGDDDAGMGSNATFANIEIL